MKAIESNAAKLSINHDTLRSLGRREETDAGTRPGLTTDERARMRDLEREYKELRRANETLKAASAFLGADRPSDATIVFTDQQRSQLGIEPISRVHGEHGCKIAPNT